MALKNLSRRAFLKQAFKNWFVNKMQKISFIMSFCKSKEVTSKGMTTTKNPLINLMTTIYFTNHQKGQLVDFLKKYPCVIYVKNPLNVNFKNLHSNKIKSVCTLTLKFSK